MLYLLHQYPNKREANKIIDRNNKFAYEKRVLEYSSAPQPV